MEKVEKIIDELKGRSGFDDIFSNIDKDILEEIKLSIQKIINE